MKNAECFILFCYYYWKIVAVCSCSHQSMLGATEGFGKRKIKNNALCEINLKALSKINYTKQFSTGYNMFFFIKK